MAIEINRKSGIPLYIQLKQQIAENIEKRIWAPGYKLPTEREMALMLGVSRNTVSMAYKELEAEGVLVSHQGRGTFVASQCVESGETRLLELIDAALEEATRLGYSFEEFVEVTQKRVSERKSFFHQVKIAFIECNREQVDYIAKELELGSGVSIIPIVLSEFKDKPRETHEKLRSVDFVVTTFFHIAEVKQLLNSYSFDILGIALDPQLETIVKIARFPKGKKVGLVCLSHNFAEKVINSIESAGITYLNIEYTISQCQEELKRLIESCDYLMASPGRKKEVDRLVPQGLEVVEFVYRPDFGSINMLKEAVLKHQQKDRGREAYENN